MALVIKGTVVPLTRGDELGTFEGRIFIADRVDGVGKVEAVRHAGQSAPAGFANAPTVDAGDAFIYPGLIDLHSHVAYNTLPLWTQPNESQPFLHHDIWPGRSTYKPCVSWPAWVLAKAAPEALLTYVQLRALAGGTTAIQGWPSSNRDPANQLVRNIDYQKFYGEDRTRTSTLTLDQQSLRNRAEAIEDGLGFIYHCSEGQVGSIVAREFDDVRQAGCLRQGLIAIHCCAIGEAEFQQWKSMAVNVAGDPGPGTVVWSPFSNLWLYGQTTAVPAARAHDVKVCLGTDWGPSGTKNLLGELKVARLWSDKMQWGLTNFDLVEMVTTSPGDALGRCWNVKTGRIEPDGLADVAVLRKRSQDPWNNLVAAHETDVILVTVNGRPLYGTKDLMTAGGATRTTSVGLGPERRRTVLINPAEKDEPEPGPWTWNKVLDALRAVKADPVGSVSDASEAIAAGGAIPEVIGSTNDPLVLDLDMPGGLGMVAGSPPPGVVTDIPSPLSLRHDLPWRASVKKGGFHAGVLDDLDSFYV